MFHKPCHDATTPGLQRGCTSGTKTGATVDLPAPFGPAIRIICGGRFMDAPIEMLTQSYFTIAAACTKAVTSGGRQSFNAARSG